jgi:hypothetical protein
MSLRFRYCRPAHRKADFFYLNFVLLVLLEAAATRKCMDRTLRLHRGLTALEPNGRVAGLVKLHVQHRVPDFRGVVTVLVGHGWNAVRSLL